jgi:hypothetical protein
MWRYFQPLSRGSATSGGNNVSSDTTVQGEAAEQPNVGRAFNPDDIVADPALRRQIEEYDSNAQDQVRRAYILKSQCQPKGLDFPHRQYGRGSRPFKGHHIAFIAFFLSECGGGAGAWACPRVNSLNFHRRPHRWKLN